MASINTVSFEEMNALLKSKKGIVIDVREPSELAETGEIPGSVNIPLGELKTALSTMPDNKFRSKYGIEKPKKDEKLIFSCRSGRRSEAAVQEALTSGYSNVFSFSGGWIEWESHTKHK